MTESIIEVKNLSHRYGDFLAVDNISFSVRKNEIFSFLGPNGAGKSTVINVLITLLNLQDGTVTIAGHDLKDDPGAVRKSIGIVFQEITLDRDMTVCETLEFHGRLYNIPEDKLQSRIKELIMLVELEDKRDTLTKNLSGGMKRRLEIARGLMTRPRVLFLDEPTIGLDPQSRIRMWDYLRSVNDEGTTIFLTTHYMDEADHLSDRVNIIDNGKIIVSGTPKELKNTLGEDIIYLKTGDDESTIELAGKMDCVKNVEKTEKGVILMVAGDGTKLLPGILDLIGSEGISVSRINMKKPSMDDVFVHYTGQEIRDERPQKFSLHSRRR
ncbi:MAG: ATP-binding cassette domain-containing protein [Methanogenium sp.]|nr:ATP-binding cassette domain-containing protein [Methanogenium sp.]